MKIIYKQGDAVFPEELGNLVIVQINNDIGAYGAGFSGAVARRWPIVEDAYREWYKMDEFGAGEVQFVLVDEVFKYEELEQTVWVANMVAQHKIRSISSVPPIRYDWLENCLDKVAEFCVKNNAQVVAPRIGAGLSGGSWPVIEDILINRLIKKGISVTIYDLKQ